MRSAGVARSLRPWVVLVLWALLAGPPLAAVVHWLGTAGRLGSGGAVLHALEYSLLPMAQGLLRLVILVVGLGVPLQFLVSRMWPPGRRLVPAALSAATVYLCTLYFTSSPNLNEFYRGDPELSALPSGGLQGVLAVALAALAALGCRRLFTDPTERSTRPAKRITVGLAAAAMALLGLALARPYLFAASQDGSRNVILISMDTLRADHLGAYGYPRPTSPNIDRLASRGLVFDNAASQAPWTLPAHMSLFTGLYPSVHGMTEFSMDKEDWRPLRPKVRLLSELLQSEGYVTAAFTGGGFIGPAFGFHRGFDLYRTDSRRLEVFQPAVLRWLRRNHDRRFFLFVHFYNTHLPYAPPAPFDELFRQGSDTPPAAYPEKFCHQAEQVGVLPDEAQMETIVSRYDGEIAYADELLGELFDQLSATGLDDETLVVFFSDHGDELFEHGNCDHIKSLYDPLVRVPLIVAGPGLPTGRVAEAVELREVSRLVLDYLGVDRKLGLDERSLLAALRGERALDAASAAFSETCCLGYEIRDGGWAHKPWSDGALSLRNGRLKLVADPAGNPLEAYDLESDPGEQRNLLAIPDLAPGTRSEIAALESRLAALLERIAEQREILGRILEGDEPLDETTLDQLRDLGYLQ